MPVVEVLAALAALAASVALAALATLAIVGRLTQLLPLLLAHPPMCAMEIPPPFTIDGHALPIADPYPFATLACPVQMHPVENTLWQRHTGLQHYRSNRGWQITTYLFIGGKLQGAEQIKPVWPLSAGSSSAA